MEDSHGCVPSSVSGKPLVAERVRSEISEFSVAGRLDRWSLATGVEDGGITQVRGIVCYLNSGHATPQRSFYGGVSAPLLNNFSKL